MLVLICLSQGQGSQRTPFQPLNSLLPKVGGVCEELALAQPDELVDRDGHRLRDGLHPHPHPLRVLRLVLARARQQLLRLHARQVRRRRAGLEIEREGREEGC